MSYTIGEKILVKFTGNVRSKRGPKGTVAIEENGGNIHYLFLGDTGIFPEFPREGDKIDISFTAKINGRENDGPASGTEVRRPGFTHYVYLDSPSVTSVPENTKENENPIAYNDDDTITVNFTGTVGTPGKGIAGTTRIKELDNGTVHFLYLGDDSIFLYPYAQRPVEGGMVQISFSARVRNNTGELFTREVVTNDGFTHYVFLGSSSVSKTAKKNTKENENPMAYSNGDTITVAFTGTVTGSSSVGRDGTAPVKEKGKNSGYTHFLYLGDTSIYAGDRYPNGISRPSEGDTVEISFAARVTELTGDISTRQVVSDQGFTHYVFLGSPSVSKAETKTAETPIPETPVSVPVLPTDDEVSSTAVTERITELEKRPAGGAFTITRNRNGEPLYKFNGEPLTFTATSDASAYLDEQDLEPLRFTISRSAASLTDAEENELRLLRQLDNAGLILFGSSRWTRTKVLLRAGRYFSADWAKQQAAEKFGLSTDSIDGWPFNFTDWETAASAFKASKNLMVTWDGYSFWGEYSAS